MSPETENLALDIIGRIERSVDALRKDMHDVKIRLGWISEQLACLSGRIDRVELRLDRIEKRLELVEA